MLPLELIGIGILAFAVITFIVDRLRKRPGMSAARVKRLLAEMSAPLGLTVVKSMNPRECLAKGTIGGYEVLVFPALRLDGTQVNFDDISSSPLEYRLASATDHSLLVQVKGRGLAPEGIEISNQKARAQTSAPGPERLDPKELIALNQYSEKEMFDKGFFDDVDAVLLPSHKISITADTIACSLLFRMVNAEKARAIVTAAVRLAGRLSRLSAAMDWKPAVLCHKALQRYGREERIRCLRLLIRLFGGLALTKRTLERLLHDQSFEIAVTAAEESGLDLFAFTTGRLDFLTPPDQGRALRYLLDRRLPGGLEFAAGFFRKTGSAFLKQTIIDALKDAPEPRAQELFIAGLADKALPVKEAAVEALAKHGGREALGPLYRLAEDTSLPPVLRGRAKDAAAAIMEHSGVEGEGSLSLAGPGADGGLSRVADESGAGGLSLAKHEPAGDASRTDEDGPSD